jgi:Tol biopolymer transport system component
VSISEPAQITLLPVGAGQPRTIQVTGLQHAHSGWARFLPGDQRLAVSGDEAGHAARCYIVNLSSGRAQAVTPEGLVCGPISPDGRWIIGKANSGTISAFPTDGGTPKAIARKSNFNPVQWSEDGSSLYGYHAGEFPSKVYALNVGTGEETPLHELKPLSPAGVVTIAPVVVGRDGKSFAYSYNQTLSVLYLISGLH